MRKISQLILMVLFTVFVVACKPPGDPFGQNPPADDPVTGAPEEEQEDQLADINGIWRGTLVSAERGTQSISIVIDTNQRVQIVTQAGSQMAGKAIKNTAGVITADLTEYNSVATDAKVLANSITFSFDDITKLSSIAGTFSTASPENGTFQVNYDPVYESGSSIATGTVVDTWQGITELLSIGSSAVISGNGAKGCEYKGTVGIIDPSTNIYNLNISVSTCTDMNMNATDYSGTAWLDNEKSVFNYLITNSSFALSGQLSRVAKTEAGAPVTSIANVSGFWIGALSNTSTGKVSSVSGAITENNRFKLTESGDGTQYSGIVVSSDNGDVSVTADIYDSPDQGALNKNSDVKLLFKQINEKSTIKGTFDENNDGSVEGDFSLSYIATYERSSDLGKVTGEWSTATETINVNSSNKFSGQGLNGCTYSGTIGVLNPSFNVYNLNVTATNCTGSLSGEYYGIAWLDDTATENDTLNYSLVKSDGAAALSSQLNKVIAAQTPSVSGIWRGTITSSAGSVTSVAVGIVAENGRMQLTTSSGDVISGELGVDAGTDVSANAKFYKADRSASYDIVFSGTISEKNTLVGTYTKTDPLDTNGSFSLVYDVTYEQASKQSLISGNWGEQFESALLNSIGTLKGTNTSTDCTLTGAIGILSPSFNAYNVNISTANCQSASLNGNYAGLATLSDTSGDGAFDTLTYIVDNGSQYLTKIFTKTSSLASITGVWRGTFTGKDGLSTFYKGLISEDNEVKLLADTESFPWDQGSDVISGAAVVHTKDLIFSDQLKEIPANNDSSKILTITLEGVVVEKDSLAGTFEKKDSAGAVVDFGNFSFKYSEEYVIPEVNFFVINDTEWSIEKFNNNSVNFYNQYLNLSGSFVLNSDRTTVVTTEPKVEVIAGPTETDVTASFTVAPDDTREVVTTISATDTTGSIVNIVSISRVTTTETVTETSYTALLGSIFRTVTVTATSTTTTTTVRHVDSNNCRYLGNYDVVDPKANVWNLYMVVSGCNDLPVRDSAGNNLGSTYNLNGIYTGLATLEEQFSIVAHPHDHFNFMTFGMVDSTGTKTINNRLTLQYFGN